jgi:hypothetical protein
MFQARRKTMSILAKFRSLRCAAVRRRAIVACGVLASLSICGTAAAQFGPSIDLSDLPILQPVPPPEGYPPTVAPTAVGTYFVPPSWSPTLAPNARFVILSNFGSDAVLDRETGLVWARQSLSRTLPPITEINMGNADQYCSLLIIGNRKGWRLPTVAELQSLLDRSRIFPNAPRPPALPVGHPFALSRAGTNPTGFYWTAEGFSNLGLTQFGFNRRIVDLGTGLIRNIGAAFGSIPSGIDGLCVRGGAAIVDEVPL